MQNYVTTYRIQKEAIMKITVLGAAGQIAQRLVQRLTSETEHELVLFAHSAERRLQAVRDLTPTRIQLVDTTFADTDKLSQAISGGNLVILTSMSDA